MLPLVIAGVGIIASIIGTFFVSIKNNEAKEKQVQQSLNMGNYVALALTLISCWFLIDMMLPETIQMKFFGEGYKEIASSNVFFATVVGLAVGLLISAFTEHFTALGKKPVLNIVQNSSTGAATNIIAGLATGMKSTFSSVLLFAVAIWGSYELAGFYGVAIAASAMMATTAMQLAIDAFGPIADNAGGIAEMSELPKEVRGRTDILDSVGNTTAAVGKGFAIASAALTALALFAAYVTFTGIDGINIFKADVLAALFIGGMIPVIFSALAMQSVGKAAMDMVNEVRRQFREIPGIMEGKGTPEYGKCVDISTKAALREMMLPGAITIITPIIIGFVMGAEALGAYMAGVAVSGVLWAIFQNNAGGAWDNAKKSFEAGVEINGQMTYKGSDAHKAAVTGDTVGDPFKDTSGPSMNILIKLTCLVGLVIAPILGGHTSKAEVAKVPVMEEVKVVMPEPTNISTNLDTGLLDAYGNYKYDVGEISTLTLLGIDVGLHSSERKIVNLLLDDSFDVEKEAKQNWITLDRTYFKSGSDELMEESEEQLKNIVLILKSFPKAGLRIGGYTDNSGDSENNVRLSKRRAESVKIKLIALGADASQLSSEGYGDRYPICPENDTPECRAKNRRVDVRLTSK